MKLIRTTVTRSARIIASAATALPLLTSSLAAQAPDSAMSPAPAPEDVASIQAVISTVYEVISGPASEERDWDRFRSLFAPGARLIPTRRNDATGHTEASIITVEDFVELAGEAYKRPGGFFENEIGQTTEVYGNIAHSFSSYESFREGESEPFMRGINSFQLYNDGEKWQVLSIMWQAERPDNMIPGKYLFE